MLFIEDIKDFLPVERQITPSIDKNNKNNYGGVIFTMSPDALSTTEMLNSKLLNLIHYKIIYTDSKFKEMVYNKPFYYSIQPNYLADIDIYKENLKMIKPVKNILSIMGKNFIYDNNFYIKTFLSFNKKTVDIVCKEFIKVLSNIISNQYILDNKYTKKVILIDAVNWLSVSDTKNKLSNPVNILYICMRKYIELVRGLGNVDIVILNGNTNLFKFNTLNINKNSYNSFKSAIHRLDVKLLDTEIDNIKDIDTNENKEKNISMLKNKLNLKDIDMGEATKDLLNDKIENIKDDDPNATGEDIINKLQNDTELASELNDIRVNSFADKSISSRKRDEELYKNQLNVKFGDKTLNELLFESNRVTDIDVNDISKTIKTTNVNMYKVKYNNFEKSYNKYNYEKDIVAPFYALSEKKDLPVYIRKIDRVDSSDAMNQKETLTFHLEDANRVRHTFTIDIPKFVDDKYLYLGGNRKRFVTQQILKPIVKIAPDTVQICTNYKKIFMYRYGTAITSKIEKFKKMVESHPEVFKVEKGNGSKESMGCKTSLEYDSIAEKYMTIEILNIPNKRIVFYFSKKKLMEDLNKYDKAFADSGAYDISNISAIVFNPNKKITLLHNHTGADMNVDDGDIFDLVDQIISVYNTEFKNKENKLTKLMNEFKSGNKFFYSRCKIMARFVPTILLVAYYEGLSTVLNKAKINHRFSDTRANALNDYETIIPFANGYLIYDTYPLKNSILLNGLSLVPTKLYNYEDFDSKSVYLDIFESLYSTRILASGFDAFYDNMIDPISKEILEDMGYPTDLVGLLIEASGLLTNNNYTPEGDLSIFRFRSNEMVSAMMYNIISDAYSTYKRTATNKNPVKMSVPKDALLKQLLTSQVVEDDSILNPIVELEKNGAATCKGPSGINVDRAYTIEKRCFDKSMMGVYAMSTSPDKNCGVVRELTWEPKIANTRGYVKDNEDIDRLKDVNVFSGAELLTPLGITKDDTIRSAMASKQSKHIVPVANASPVLISNGAEKALPYHIGNDFTVVAKHDGVIKDIDTESGIMVLEYTNPDKGEDKYQLVNLNNVVVKNGAGGFHLSNKLISKFKKGNKFKKNDIIAYNDKFFGDYQDGVKLNIGTLAKVAIVSTYSTYEDSNLVTEKLSNKMASEIVVEKNVVLAPTANVDYIVNVGDKVETGDTLIKFEQTRNDEGMNKLLANIGSELKEEITDLGKSAIHSKYTGVIEDIKIYTTEYPTDLSPSLGKIVKEYWNRIKKKKDLVKKYNIKEAGNTADSYKELIEPIVPKNGKVAGEIMESGVLIKIYIKYYDNIAIGDKIVDFAALKTVNGEVIPKGLEPFSTFRPDEEVSSAIPPISIYGRMVPSIVVTMMGNKALIELKRKLGDIWFDGKYDYTHDLD